MSDTEDTKEQMSTSQKSFVEDYNTIQKDIPNDISIKINSTIEIISDLLVRICEDNKIKKSTNNNYLLKSFTNKKIPSISIKDYLIRLAKHTKANESTIILILIYIDRICNINHFCLTYHNIHKLILASFILAIKYNEDNYYSMTYYSKIGGISLSELKNLESEYLVLIRFKLFVQSQIYDKYYNDLMSLKIDDNVDEYESEEEEDEQDEIEDDNFNHNQLDDMKIIKNISQNEIINETNILDNNEKQLIRF